METALGEERLRRRLLDTAAELRTMAQHMAPHRRDCLLADAQRLEAMADEPSDDRFDPRFNRHSVAAGSSSR
ncbi:MAG: hypothetical protein KDA49_13920 [Rhodospirillaceae bacterium]|nr:hypothetical protein [Rhodospirillaceae bacterium]MCA8933569.1 hypothetical protein [Rhodospirillaceae bacterium]